MSLRSRLRSLERVFDRGGNSGCARCDDPQYRWRAVLVLNAEDERSFCHECGRLIDANGNPIGIASTGGGGKLIVLHDIEERRTSDHPS